MAFHYSPKIVTDGLVLYLDAANTKSYISGSTTWNDISRGGSIGTLVNGPTFNSANGGSIVFDGVDDGVSVNSAPFSSPTNSLSFNFWVYGTGTSTSSQSILGRDLNSGAIPHILIRRTSNLNLTFNYSNGTSAQTYPISDVFLNNLSKWVNLQITSNYTTGTVILYRNGILYSQFTMSTPVFPNTTVPVYVGSFASAGFIPWTGNISITQIYNRTLSATEVLQNYNATKSRYGLL
jgi:hypothetical protein